MTAIKENVAARIKCNDIIRPYKFKRQDSLFFRVLRMNSLEKGSILFDTPEGGVREVPAYEWLKEACEKRLQEAKDSQQYYREQSSIPLELRDLMVRSYTDTINQMKHQIKRCERIIAARGRFEELKPEEGVTV